MKALGVIGVCVALAVGIPVGCSVVGSINSVGTAPGRMVSDTMTTQNIRQSYEYFHDASQNFVARTAQVKQWKDLVANTTDPSEKSRLTIELAAIQQGCRDLAAEYNSNSAKINHGIFRGTTTPTELDSSLCE